MIDRKSSKEWHTLTRMDDVDYLVEDNAMDDFRISSGMDVTHGRTTFGDDPEQELLRRQPIVKWHKDGAS